MLVIKGPIFGIWIFGIRNLDFWLRIAQTTYTDREVLKSGWDEIEGNKMTEIKLQLRYKF